MPLESKSKSKVRIARNIENESCSTTWVDRRPQNSCRTLPQPDNSQSWPQKVKNHPKIEKKKISELTESYKMNFDSTSSQPHFNLSLKLTSTTISTSTLTSTQYGCDIKALQFLFITLFKFSEILNKLYFATFWLWKHNKTSTSLSFLYIILIVL